VAISAVSVARFESFRTDLLQSIESSIRFDRISKRVFFTARLHCMQSPLKHDIIRIIGLMQISDDDDIYATSSLYL